ncbi:hypothetical protein HNQ91_001139 [Filimonas zeae]|uniref:NHL repeat-containing protein n=1 Tax=Filimonas zeae TaxID=1737353 RepID=A0A917ISA3_9BACT|nr:hypothetical protein [Filimonas zeae]MDR6338117.1 hypothetical protein [Filimonas zeae]GGH61806.1 hypothetical protein GCM10011379_11140 [Filimonas zeae]
MKHLISLIAATIVAIAPLQAQLFNKLKEKVNNAVKNSANKAVDKTIDKTVSKPIDNTVNKQLDNIGGKKASGNEQNSTGNPAAITTTTNGNSGNKSETPFTKETFAPEAHVVNRPWSVATDSKDNLYVADNDGIIRIFSDGTKQRITSAIASEIIIDGNDNMYVTRGGTLNRLYIKDDGSFKIEYYTGDKNYNSAGDGDLSEAKFNKIASISVAKNGDIYIADNAWYLIKNKLTTPADELAMEPGVPQKLYQNDRWYYIRKISNGKVTSLKNKEGRYLLLFNVCGIAVDEEDNIIYSGGGASRAVKKLDTKNCTWHTVAGKPYKREWCPEYVTGDTSKAELFDPGFILLNKKGGIVYADNRNHRITQIANGKVSTLAGNSTIEPCSSNKGGLAREGYKDGNAQTALFNFPQSMAYDSKGNLFIVDSKSQIIRKLSPDGIVSSVTPFDKAKANINNYY